MSPDFSRHPLQTQLCLYGVVNSNLLSGVSSCRAPMLRKPGLVGQANLFKTTGIPNQSSKKRSLNDLLLDVRDVVFKSFM